MLVEIPTLHCQAPKVLFCMPLFLVLYVPPALSQKAQPGEAVLRKYDLHIGMKTDGVAEKVNLLPLGSRKDFTELIIKKRDDQLRVYRCPKRQEEMCIRFSKRDEVVVTGSKAKQDTSDVILNRELVKGTDTLSFRDGKGNTVWDPHTSK